MKSKKILYQQIMETVAQSVIGFIESLDWTLNESHDIEADDFIAGVNRNLNTVFEDRLISKYIQTLKIAKKYDNFIDFYFCDRIIFEQALKYHWLKKFKWLFNQKAIDYCNSSKRNKSILKEILHDYDICKMFADIYKTEDEFKKKCPVGYLIASNNHWKESLFPYLTILKEMEKEMKDKANFYIKRNIVIFVYSNNCSTFIELFNLDSKLGSFYMKYEEELYKYVFPNQVIVLYNLNTGTIEKISNTMRECAETIKTQIGNIFKSI